MTARTQRPMLLVDSTAARLSRWLRFLGLDCALDRTKSTARLLVRARREGRILLTRNGSFRGTKAAEILLLNSDHLPEQLRQVMVALGVEGNLSPRCTVCNSELIITPRVNADARVPEFVYRSQSEFAFCENCDRYYWRGTHWKSVRNSSALLTSEISEHETSS